MKAFLLCVLLGVSVFLVFDQNASAQKPAARNLGGEPPKVPSKPQTTPTPKAKETPKTQPTPLMLNPKLSPTPKALPANTSGEIKDDLRILPKATALNQTIQQPKTLSTKGSSTSNRNGGDLLPAVAPVRIPLGTEIAASFAPAVLGHKRLRELFVDSKYNWSPRFYELPGETHDGIVQKTFFLDADGDGNVDAALREDGNVYVIAQGPGFFKPEDVPNELELNEPVRQKWNVAGVFASERGAQEIISAFNKINVKRTKAGTEVLNWLFLARRAFELEKLDNQLVRQAEIWKSLVADLLPMMNIPTPFYASEDRVNRFKKKLKPRFCGKEYELEELIKPGFIPACLTPYNK